jgi:hypothetical protein
MNISLCARICGVVAAIGFVVGVSLVAQQPPAAQAPGAPRPAAFTEIHPDRTVTFRLLAPKASEVTLNGSWDNAVNLKMTKDEAGMGGFDAAVRPNQSGYDSWPPVVPGTGGVPCVWNELTV